MVTIAVERNLGRPPVLITQLGRSQIQHVHVDRAQSAEAVRRERRTHARATGHPAMT